MSRSELIQLSRSSYGVSSNGFIAVSRTGEISAEQPALSLFWAWELPSSTFAAYPCVLERLRLQYTCLTAFTSPVAVGRGLAFVKLTDAPGGGTGTGPVNHVLRKDVLLNSLSGGGILTSNATALEPPTTPPSLDDVFAQLSLAGKGNAGDTVDKEWKWTSGDAQMVTLLPGDIIGLMCPSDMDAAGTFELVIEADLQGVQQDLPEP
jgi:hypothetical protein